MKSGQGAGGKAATIGAMTRRRAMERIELLCASGAGLNALAVPLCEALHDIVPTMANAAFWVDEAGEPAGYYHDGAPADLKDFYTRNFDRLFANPADWTMLTMLEVVEPSVGRMLDPAMRDWGWRSPIHHYLCAPLGHHHVIDIRVDHDGRGRILFALWRGEDEPYSPKDAALLAPVQRLVEAAIANARNDLRWVPLGNHAAHFMTDLAGTELRAIDAEAERLLGASHLLRQNVRTLPPFGDAPGFATALAAMLAAGAPAELAIPVAGGRIVARATRSRLVRQDDGSGDQMMVSLDHEVAIDVLAAEYAAQLQLTFLQKSIVLFALQGGARASCEARFGVSDEALKKHLRAVYDATATTGWAELAALEPGLVAARQAAA